jgi:hypothetical protein
MSKKFTGDLLIPIEPPNGGGSLMTAAELQSLVQSENARIFDERWRKLGLLAAHYAIETTGSHYAALAMALAVDLNVPGFQLKAKRGAPEKWPDFLRTAVVVEMQEIVDPATKGKGPQYAARVLAKREPWNAFLAGLSEPAEALLNVYKAHQKDSLAQKWAKVFHKSRQMDAAGHSQLIKQAIEEEIRKR